MTQEEREKLIEEMVRAIYGCTYDPDNFDEPFEDRKHWIMTASAALAIAEPLIREDCIKIAESKEGEFSTNDYSRGYNDGCAAVGRAILASIPEKNNDR